MSRRLARAFLLSGVCVALLGDAAAAQGSRNLLLSLLGGIGGSIDEDQSGLGNASFQLGLASETDAGILVGVRIGTISYGSADSIGVLADPSVEYVNVGGEYRFEEFAWDSGIYFALGAYRLEGRVGDRLEDDTSIGGALGVTGDFELTRRFSVVGEVAVHLMASDFAEFLFTGHVGLAASF